MRIFALTAVLVLSAATAQAQSQCGGDFSTFVTGLKKEAVGLGHSRSVTNKFFRSAAIDPKVLRADRSQGIFKMTFTDFSGRVISQNRMVHGKRNAEKYASVFKRAEQEYGVSRGVILAFWAKFS